MWSSNVEPASNQAKYVNSNLDVDSLTFQRLRVNTKDILLPLFAAWNCRREPLEINF